MVSSGNLKKTEIGRRLNVHETFNSSCSANQWTGFSMITASVMKGLSFHFESLSGIGKESK